MLFVTYIIFLACLPFLSFPDSNPDRLASLVCDMVASGVWAVFGPQSPSVAWLIRSIAANLHIPHLHVNWDYRSAGHRSYSSNMTVNLHPEPSALSMAFMDLVESRNWKAFTLIYEESEGNKLPTRTHDTLICERRRR